MTVDENGTRLTKLETEVAGLAAKQIATHDLVLSINSKFDKFSDQMDKRLLEQARTKWPIIIGFGSLIFAMLFQWTAINNKEQEYHEEVLRREMKYLHDQQESKIDQLLERNRESGT